MYKKQLTDIIESTLKEFDMYSQDAVNLLLGTAAQESGFGKFIRQLNCGPARGIFQMEPATFQYLLKYVKNKGIEEQIKSSCNCIQLIPESLEYNLKLAIVFCRLRYLVVNEPLPSDLKGYAAYWKKYYNSVLGAGTEEQFIKHYKKYVESN